MENGAFTGQLLLKMLLTGAIEREASAKFAAIAQIHSENSKDGQLFRQIVDELLKVDPKNYARVRDYFFSLNDNIARGGVKNPRDFAARMQRIENGGAK